MMLRRALNGQALAAVADKWSLPAWIEDLCEWLRFLAYESDAAGILHLCQSGEPVSWHGYALAALESAVKHGLLHELPPVAEQKLDEQAGFRDARPRHTAMSSGRLASLLGRPVRPYQEAVELAVARYAADPTFLSRIS